ncbi:MAG: MtrB/PioB family decaheme-associated outer membrane protein [Rubrivivax sp.]|nr:MtrB/PioB family decaheme-associated outer membrane protein [Rubrivivax sp.]MBP9910213.1 MtrB/PioB family decaheme-associated outer membrane protein [Rubrivivax sp.]
MRIHSPLFLLAALGVLGLTGPVAAQVDTSQWKCEKCPYKKGTTGHVDAGVGYTTDDSTTFGNYTGLPDQGLHLVLGGQVSHRGEGGYFADLSAADLGLDIRTIDGEAGREGQYSMWLGYAQIPRYFAEGAQTPFLGNGSNLLTLPAGYPGAVTGPATAPGAMPLAATLQPVEIGYDASRFEVGGKWVGQEHWTYRASLRRDVREGTRPGAGSFFSTAAQLASPVDHTTDQFEVAASYDTARWQATLAYQLSAFKNGNEALNWANPFNPVVPGATQGQLALAPDNQFHQITGSASYQITPTLRASTDIAWGQGRQDESFLPATANAVLLPSVPALPAASLDGEVNTFNFNAKLTATPVEGLRLNALYARDMRDNETAVLAYPQVATDIFLDTALRSNTPYDLTQDRISLNADYRGLEGWKLNGGYDWDSRQRNYSEVVTTRENTVWGRATVQALEPMSLTLDLAYGDRSHSTYGTSVWVSSPQNPLMRKVNLAARERTSAGLRADWVIGDAVTLGLGANWANDDYDETVIGLNEAESRGVVGDISVMVSDETRFHAFAQGEQIESRQTGSQSYGAPDWTGNVKDRMRVVGFGIKHAAVPDKFEVGADLSFSRSTSDTSVQTVMAEPPFARAETSLDTVKLYASYRLNESLWLNGSYWFEQYESSDWRLDTVQPGNVYNLLAFGNLAPQYRVNVFRVSVRYQF